MHRPDHFTITLVDEDILQHRTTISYSDYGELQLRSYGDYGDYEEMMEIEVERSKYIY